MSMDHPAGLYVTEADLKDAAVRDEIDSYVTGHAEGAPFHRPAWLIAVQRATANPAHLLVARTAGGRLRGVLPLTEMRSRLFGRALVSSGFAVEGGILADEPGTVDALGAAACDLNARLGCASIELRGGARPEGRWHGRDDSHVAFSRPLAADDAQELAAIPRKHRAELRKALANAALRVAHGVSDRLVRDHYRVYAASVRNLGTPVFPRALFRHMLEAFGGAAEISVVYHGDIPVSAVFSLYHRGRVMPYWGGGVQAARGLRSNELLYFSLMRHAQARGCTVFDFGRSRAGSGQAAWKRSFGFEPRPLRYHLFTGDQPARDISPESAKYRLMIETWKKLPLPVANLVGPWLARGLG